MSTRHVLGFIVGILAVGLSAVATADSFQWTPGWKQGDYWIVRSPLVRHSVDAGVVTPVSDGYYFTRFLVKSDTATPASRTIVLEIKYRENEDFTFDQMLDSLELVVDMSNVRVRRVRELGWREDGTWMDDETKIAPDAPDIFELGYPPHGVPDTCPVIIPMFKRVTTSTGNGFVLESVTKSRTSEPNYEAAQTVQLTPTGALLEFWTGPGAVEHAPQAKAPYRLVLKPGSPWPDVEESDGTPLATVVETGILP